ncbi:unnamed protein product [Trichogramma brassicae]|uniref:Uncharacterized protein n=1 Tax=Trichogramma brassicae TaxID=86971 RepID=A0A6H5IR93_9HYME|nr:unnamed protein product [Trichogramma brassicae]
MEAATTAAAAPEHRHHHQIHQQLRRHRVVIGLQQQQQQQQQQLRDGKSTAAISTERSSSRAPASSSTAAAPVLPNLDVVRALHQCAISTIFFCTAAASLSFNPDSSRVRNNIVFCLARLSNVALSVSCSASASSYTLYTSREELRRLKKLQVEDPSAAASSIINDGNSGGKSNVYGETVERLALENHVLRRRLLNRSSEFSSDAATSPRNPDAAPAATATATATVQVALLAPKKVEFDFKMEPTEEAAVTEQKSELTDTASSQEPQSSTLNESQDKEETSENTSLDKNDEESEAAESAVASGGNKLASQGASNESENESEELDDIELIFTTEETCPEVGREDLVPIGDSETWQQQQQLPITPCSNEPHKSVLKICQAKSADSGEPSCTFNPNCNGSNATSTTITTATTTTAAASGATSSSAAQAPATAEKSSSMDDAAGSSQSSSIDHEESIDRFDESSSSRLNKMWSQCSVLVETDISKCGVLEEVDLQTRNAARRNTLAAPPTAYRPIIHREALAAGRRKSATPLRPVLDHASAGNSGSPVVGGSAAGGGARRESGAQTDISALPAQWRSESYLAHKVAHTFTTLPSKFALPAGVAGRLRLSDKTREARRVMLSDISFTSMVPELSRSADHLCQEAAVAAVLQQYPGAQCYGSRASGLRTPEANRRESWARGAGLPSPCECRLSVDVARYRGSLSSIHSSASVGGVGSAAGGGDSRRHSWRPNAAASFEGYCRVPSVTLAPSASSHHCCGVGATTAVTGPTGATLLSTRTTWSSMPSSPTHVQPPSAAVIARLHAGPKRSRSKVTFQECPILIRGSLPNLRSEQLLGETSGDSTESLIDEAEEYLRRSIDSMLTLSTTEKCRHGSSGSSGGRHSTRRRRVRRHSEPDLLRDWNPPQDARPYLPKVRCYCHYIAHSLVRHSHIFWPLAFHRYR